MEKNFYLEIPKGGEGGGGERGDWVSRVPLLSSYFCGWLSSFPVLASVEKKKRVIIIIIIIITKKSAWKKDCFINVKY